ncbi:NAD-dependent epimerase/dehydratase family protein [Paraburkholderia sabiae]|uniref:NAD-dependent epimerase/dehydratase family protein n=1 Tax=Paraburkholderia sabiae TaxID=273251 RepID=A0ABU9QJS4_9BURK|nr:NAD-dependent epimerase/dehydratase family protein [Paraburkholderia sabiae]WJZ73482.1 NAD-dependent epimerase/dehydratase family protein [Paraburkholderia sabiae]CAD6542208.1 UDP-glucose 4-epimerase [Paraburkholderia sabiae]
MRITVFGGGGFIGSTIVDRLLRDNHEICVFERPRVGPYRPFNDSEKVNWMTGDLTSMHDVTEAIDGSDIVVHLVSTTLPKSSNDDPIYDVQSNLVATLQLLNAMVAKNVKKIVFISSGGTVYGDPVYLPIDEKHPTNPKVSYGITKLAIEKYLLLYQYQHGIKANILRVANPYGERQRVETAQGAIAVFLDKALRKQPFEIWGDGTVTRDYLYISDVAEAFARAVQYDGSESVFNISSGYGTSLNEIIGKIEAILEHPVERTYRAGRPFDVPASVLDNTLAKRELGWEPKVALDAGIKMTAAWLRSQIHE